MDTKLCLAAQIIIDDPRSPMDPSGIRVGVQAITSRGMKEKEIKMIVEWIDAIITAYNDKKTLAEIKKDVTKFCKKFPIYPSV
ncbi:MAG: Serine hydroxymethyltransferase [Candidatus Moranbacteria bacterium GW2011_GWD1_36_198]|nr:MAG: Serine hydroxymethyltransferase [Candidatus Moranbacteria bacterium GW2011_GWD1_36_198]